MRKIILLLAMSCALNVTAQNYFGIKTGINNSTIEDNSYQSEPIAKIDYTAGLTFEHISNNIVIGTEILFERKGFQSRVPYSYTSNLFNMNYISMPLKVGYISSGKFYGLGNVGLVPSILISSNIMPTYISYIGNITYSNPIPRFDISNLLEIGVGYRQSKFVNLVATLRYQNSIALPGISGENTIQSDKTYFKNNTLSFLFGANFRL